MKELPAAITAAVSLILCVNVYAVIFHMFLPHVDNKLRRAVKYWMVTYQQAPKEKRLDFWLLVMIMVSMFTWFAGPK